MEVLRSGITGTPPQRYRISNGLEASLYRWFAWLKPYRLVLKGNCTEVGGDLRPGPPTFVRDDVTNPRRMPDDRQAVIDVQEAITVGVFHPDGSLRSFRDLTRIGHNC